MNWNTQEKKLKFTQEVISKTENWKKIIFIDEKMFNLDDSNGQQVYLHDQ